MKINKTIYFILTLSLCMLSINAFADKKHSTMGFEVISQGGQSGIGHQMSMVIDNYMHWEQVWRMHTQFQFNPEPLPKVDFDTEVVIAQFLGSLASCGFDINTERVKNKKSYVAVETVVTLPAEPILCLVAEQPYEFIKIARTDTLVRFKLEMEDDYRKTSD